MSRCKSCDVKLTDYELTIKYAESGTYVDLCSSCLRPIRDQIEIITREDLNNVISSDDESDEVFYGYDLDEENDDEF